MRLTIHSDHSVLETNHKTEVFNEGKQSDNAKKRMKKLKETLSNGFLEQLIESQLKNPNTDITLEEEQLKPIRDLVDSVTSEVGRALIGLSVMQLCIKAICPEQNIRLHKGGNSGKSNFSWIEGMSMRTLDKAYITPVLRKHKLLKLNADGFMMTRSLAENYPYTKLYKAAIRGAKDSWLEIVDQLEINALDPYKGLKFLISLLANRTIKFSNISEECIKEVSRFAKNNNSEIIINFIKSFIIESEYSARLFELSIHSAFQVLSENDELEGSLKPLSQMRSANKKHGNIGDVEVLLRENSPIIQESWDAKYGKRELREELEELSEKLMDHPECELAGFITDRDPIISDEIVDRIGQIQELHETDVLIISFEDFFEKYILERTHIIDFHEQWIKLFAESLCQNRRHVAPIDEPCHEWVNTLLKKCKSL